MVGRRTARSGGEDPFVDDASLEETVTSELVSEARKIPC